MKESPPSNTIFSGLTGEGSGTRRGGVKGVKGQGPEGGGVKG